MKEKIIKFLIIVIVFFSLPSFSYSYESTFAPSYIQTNDFIAYSTINAATISLANGQIISNAKVIGTSTNTSRTILNDIDIILIIDTSGSMHNSIDTVKSAAIQLADKFLDNYDNSRIALISFETDATLQSDFTNDKNYLHDKINNLNASGGTYLLKALNLINTLSFSSNPEAKKTIITLTDGATNEASTCQSRYKDFYSENYLIYNISLGGDYTDAFIDESRNPIGNLYTDVEANNLNNIYDEIYNNIYEEFSQTSIDDTFILDCQNAFCVNNSAYFIVDNELAQSALLTVEYLFDIKPNFYCTDLNIVDIIGDNFSYNPDSKLLSEESTNAEQGWEYFNDDRSKLYYQKNSNDGNYVIQRYSDFQIKIVLTRLLANSSSTDNIFENSVEFSIAGTDYRGNTINYSCLSSSLPSSQLDFTVYIIPPFGSTTNYNYINLLYIFLFIVTFVIILVASLKRKHN